MPQQQGFYIHNGGKTDIAYYGKMDGESNVAGWNGKIDRFHQRKDTD